MSRYQSSCALDCKVYVGGLTRNASREEVERAFGHYGKLKNVFVARNPPGFAFIEYEDPQDAEDSVRALDGRMLCGVRVRVEISHGKSRNKSTFKRSDDRDRDSVKRRRSRSIEKRRDSYSRSKSRSRSSSRTRTQKVSRDRKANERVRDSRDSRGDLKRKTASSRISRSRSRS